jgi:hypothetical protein
MGKFRVFSIKALPGPLTWDTQVLQLADNFYPISSPGKTLSLPHALDSFPESIHFYGLEDATSSLSMCLDYWFAPIASY